MSDPMIERIPIDILHIEFGERSLNIQYVDTRLEGDAGSEVTTIVIKPEMFEDRILEIRDDVYDLIIAFRDINRGVPMTRPGRVR